MKKNLPILIFIAVYLLALVAGFSYAGIRKASTEAPRGVETLQDNWILIRVDDMTLEHPQLVSVWAMFLTFSPGPDVFFKPIYSSDWSQSPYSNLSDLFTVTADRTISEKFIQELDRLNFRRSGLVILDDLGFHSFTDWFNSSLTAAGVLPFVPNTGQDQSITMSPEVQSYKAICTALVQNHPRTQTLTWRDLYPNHVLPHPSLASLANMWERIIAVNEEARCVVITGQ